MVIIIKKNIYVFMVDVFVVIKKLIVLEVVLLVIFAVVIWFSLRYSIFSYGWVDNVCFFVRFIFWIVFFIFFLWSSRFRVLISVRIFFFRILFLFWKLVVIMLRKFVLACWWCMSVWCIISYRTFGIFWSLCMEIFFS